MDKSHPSVPADPSRFTECLEQARQGDPKARSALAEFAANFSRMIARDKIRRQSRLISTPTDIGQHVAGQVVEKVDSARCQDTSHFKNWIRVIANHHIIDLVRKFGGRQPEEREGLSRIEDDTPQPAAIMENRELYLHVLEQMKSMSKEEQLLIQLRSQEELSFREIANRLVIGEETARRKYQALIERLRHLGGSGR